MPEQARADLTLIQKESARASAIIRNLSEVWAPDVRAGAGSACETSSPRYMELRQRKLEELNIAIDIDEKSQGVRHGGVHRAAAGVAELCDQRRAGDRARRRVKLRRRRGYSHRRSRWLGVDRSRGFRSWCGARTRGEAVSTVLHDEAGWRRHGPRLVGQLRHHPLAQWPHWLSAREHAWRRGVLLRITDRTRQITLELHDRIASTTTNHIASTFDATVVSAG